MELDYNAFLFDSVPIKKRAYITVSIKMKHFTVLLLFVNCQCIHKLLYIFMLPRQELYENYALTTSRSKRDSDNEGHVLKVSHDFTRQL